MLEFWPQIFSGALIWTKGNKCNFKSFNGISEIKCHFLFVLCLFFTFHAEFP
jgi:hypothetical protein